MLLIIYTLSVNIADFSFIFIEIIMYQIVTILYLVVNRILMSWIRGEFVFITMVMGRQGLIQLYIYHPLQNHVMWWHINETDELKHYDQTHLFLWACLDDVEVMWSVGNGISLQLGILRNHSVDYMCVMGKAADIKGW